MVKPMDESLSALLFLSIIFPFLLSLENKSRKYWCIFLFFIILQSNASLMAFENKRMYNY